MQIGLLVLIDLVGSLIGIRMMNADRLRGWALSLTSGILAAIALLWMLPEMSRVSGPLSASLILSIAVVVLLAFDRYVYPVCPCCTHLHGKSAALGELKRMTWPMLAGICIHNLFDGWSAAVAKETAGSAGTGLLAGILIHKLPESIILGLLMRSATKRTRDAVLLTLFSSLFLILGSQSYGVSTLMQSSKSLLISLTLAAASFLFIGIHTFRAECSRKGIRSATASLLAGVACAALVQLVIAL